jgi:hypothetical protein
MMQSLDNESIDVVVRPGGRVTHSSISCHGKIDNYCRLDQFLKENGLIEGEVTLPAPKNGVKLIKTL